MCTVHLVLIFSIVATGLALPCELILYPDCQLSPSGSLHPHELSCSLFYRCDELGIAQAFSCPSGYLFNGTGHLCAPESQVRCLTRCPQPRCGECACTTPPPCVTTTTKPPCSTEEPETTTQFTDPTTERYTPTIRTTERYSTPEAETTELSTDSTIPEVTTHSTTIELTTSSVGSTTDPFVTLL